MFAGTPAGAGTLSAHDLQLYRDAFRAAERSRWDDARSLAASAHEKLPAKVLQWLALLENGEFGAIAPFLQANPDWPSQHGLRRKAESTMSDAEPAPRLLAYFEKFPPLSLKGFNHYLGALAIAGDARRIAGLVRERWTGGDVSAADQPEFLARFGTQLRAEDHRARLDRLLWSHDDDGARRMLPLVDDGWRALAEARLALAFDRPGSEALVERVPDQLGRDPGLLYERLRWRRRKNLDDGALEILASPPKRLGRDELWWTERHILARRLIERRDFAAAYRLVSAHVQDDGLPFAEAEFLAGWLALRFLNQPTQALRHFGRLHEAVNSPISLARGAYWSGRAAEAAGDRAAARQWYEAAARHTATFYGQLAWDRLGRGPDLSFPAPPKISAQQSSAFEFRELVRAVRLLHEIEPNPDNDRAGLFLRRVARTIKTPTDLALGTRLAHDIGRPDLAIAIAKQAVRSDIILVEGGYPVRSVGAVEGVEPGLPLSVIRQESTFNSNIVSSAGARGLMQLMPDTAALVARQLKIRYDKGKLTGDPGYNIQLGSTYLASLLDRYGGSYILSIAAYNAGPGRVAGWLEQFGDPRSPNVDAVDWIELIPISETRNYVQRVLEALQVYRVRLGHGRSDRTLNQDLRR
ncbi:MAG: transglycosylase SLT domain-containing protein [Azospirillum sp.]|nr:transglycosylase SLT domain-containing protein [Azospirillum sp.]